VVIFGIKPEPPKPRTSPHSLEAEQALIGGVLLDNDKLHDVCALVQAGDFYHPGHRHMFASIEHLVEHKRPVDAVTLGTAMEQTGALQSSGGTEYLAKLVEDAPGISNILAYAHIVHDYAVLRLLLQRANEIADLALSPEGRKVDLLVDTAEQLIFSIAGERARSGGPEMISNLLARVTKQINELYKNKNTVTGLPTGFADLDELTSGLQPSDLVILAGRPSMGKTSLAMNIVEYAVMMDEPKPVVVFSLEMSASSLVMRMLASLARINQRNVSTGQLQERDWPRLTSAISMLDGRPLYIDDSAQSVSEMRARARRVAREHGGQLGLVVVDYLQLVENSRRQDNRNEEISEISRSLKGLAQELHCPLMALSQLNRSLEQRTNKRPQMSDLRESGAIEQDADLILFIYRDEVYNKDNPENKGKAEIIISKQRNGPIGDIHLTFMDHLTRFESMADEHYNA